MTADLTLRWYHVTFIFYLLDPIIGFTILTYLLFHSIARRSLRDKELARNCGTEDLCFKIDCFRRKIRRAEIEAQNH